MTRSEIAALTEHYSGLSERWQVNDRQTDYASLVKPTGNSQEPFHRWFKFKEAFSHALFDRLIKDGGWRPEKHFTLFDPFAGSGTSLLSALELAQSQGVSARLVGVERNPVMHLIAYAKLRAAAEPKRVGAALEYELEDFWSRYRSNRRKPRALVTPSVTLNNPRYYDAEHVRSLLALTRAARGCSDDVVRDVLLTCVAAAVEPSGLLRKDGRALRFSPNRSAVHPVMAFQGTLGIVQEDLSTSDGFEGHVQLAHGDARLASPMHESLWADWVVFSPPYPNNIDYTEVYKTESWALEVYASEDDMRLQRLSTLRSHPSVLFPEEYHYPRSASADQVAALIAPILRCIPADRYAKGRTQLIRGYADDMFRVLQQARRQVRNGGHAAVIVGNSAHGEGDQRFVVAADLVIAGLAEQAEWMVEEVCVARMLRRRTDDDGWMRESVIVLRAA